MALAGNAIKQIGRVDVQPTHLLHDTRPLLLEESDAGIAAQAGGGPIGDEHADAPLDDDQAVILETLISLGGGQRIGPMFGGKSADGGKGVPVTKDAIQYRFGDNIAKAKINGAILAAHCVTLF
jgi:hypothetical protein